MDGAGGGEEVLEKRRRPEETVLHEVVRRGWPGLRVQRSTEPKKLPAWQKAAFQRMAKPCLELRPSE